MKQGLLTFGLLVALLAPGCGSDTGNQGPGDVADASDHASQPDQQGDAEEPDLAGDQTGDQTTDVPVVPPGQPILERTPDIRFACEVTRDTTNHQPLRWTNGGHALVATAGGTLLLARSEANPPAVFDPAPFYFKISTLDEAGMLGAANEIPATADAISGVAALPVAQGVLLVWADGAIKTALRAEDGSEVAAPVTVDPGPSDYTTKPAVAPLGEQFGLVASVTAGSKHKVRMVRLDAQGKKSGDVVDFTTAGDDWNNPAPSIAAGEGRWGIVWQENGQAKGAIYFAAVDASGNVVVAKKRISSTFEAGVETAPSGFAMPRTSIVYVDGNWLVAWSEVRNGIDYSSGASAIIKLARLDADGNPLEEAAVRDIVVDTDEVEPMLLPFQGAMGLFWSSGSHIYMCGGCWPDHEVQFVLLDSDTLVPVSDVSTVSPTPNGLLNLSAAVQGDTITLSALIGYHVYQDPATAVLRCTKQ